ncbi:MAG: T9SS type A sorting domain-containing protein [Bacteroidetes bacterium]|nr:T9SS type A sorting domain-containing protein [Bacteroidota bacterium]
MVNKFHTIFLLAALITMSLDHDTQGQCVNNDTNVYSFIYSGRSYEIVKENKTWIDAAACAVERGGYLTEVDSVEENDILLFHVNSAGIDFDSTVAPDGGNGSYLWLGGNDMVTEADWYWDGDNDTVGILFFDGAFMNGAAIPGVYNNFAEFFEGSENYKEPDGQTNQNALGFAYSTWPNGGPGEWNDIRDTNRLYYIIEYTTIITSTKEIIKSDFQIRLFPNPTSGKVSVQGFNITEIKVWSVTGKLIHASSNNEIDLSGNPPGIYLVRINSGGRKITRKVILLGN